MVEGSNPSGLTNHNHSNHQIVREGGEAGPEDGEFVTAGEAEHHVRADLVGELERLPRAGKAEAVAKADEIGIVAEVGNRVGARPRPEEERVRAAAAGQRVPACATVEKIIATAAVERVGLVSTSKDVALCAAGKQVPTRAAIEGVPTGSSEEPVISGPAADGVRPVASGVAEARDARPSRRCRPRRDCRGRPRRTR